MKYATPRAFRAALAARLQQQALAQHLDLSRLQRRLAYERFLTRLSQFYGHTWVLKGVAALELRLNDRARATKDMDFTTSARSVSELLDDLQTAADLDLGDHFRYEVERPVQSQLAGPPEGGSRFRVKAYLDGIQPYTIFLVDVGHGDLLLNPVESSSALINLDFAGLTTPPFFTYPLPEHIAEKLHAYTRPRPGGSHTRVKDLVDLSLITEDLGLPPSRDLAQVIAAVFAHYGSHLLPLPDDLRPPPPEWTLPFETMTRQLDHPVTQAQEAHRRLVLFLQQCELDQD